MNLSSYPEVIIEIPGPFFHVVKPQGMTGTHWRCDSEYGNHTFDRFSGAWTAGPCTNFAGGRVMPAELEKLEAFLWKDMEKPPGSEAAIEWDANAVLRAAPLPRVVTAS